MTTLGQLISGSIVVLPAFYSPTLTLGELAVCILVAIGVGACWPDDVI